MSANQKLITQLIRRVKNGDNSAPQELFALLGTEREHGAAILSIARTLLPRNHAARRWVDSQDVVQSALRTGLRQIADFRGTTEGELYGWLRSIIRTKVSRAVRCDKKIQINKERFATRESPPPLAKILYDELRQSLHSAIGQLPQDQRLVVELRIRGVSTSEICELLDLKPATVRKRESRAVATLRTVIA